MDTSTISSTLLKRNFKFRKCELFLTGWIALCFLFSYSSAVPNPDKLEPDIEQEAWNYLIELEPRLSAACNRRQIVDWDYLTNVTDVTEKANTDAKTEYMRFEMKMQKELQTKFPKWRKFKNETIKREIRLLTNLGPEKVVPIDDAVIEKTAKLEAKLESNFGTASVCEYENPSNCSLRLDPELEHILKTEKDPKVLAYYWSAWHDKMSEKVPPQKYEEYVSLLKAQAQGNGYKNPFEEWVGAYYDETPEYSPAGFRNKILKIWEEIKPMYEKLYAYVRMKLKKRPEYEGLFGKCGYIPSHLTGNMWAQDWTALDSITKPYPDAPSLDATEAMIKKNYTVLKMFQKADEFFTGMGLQPMTSIFWEKSMFERPNDGRDVVCHPSAHDFCLGKGNQDYRIKQCTKVNMEAVFTIHHEVGHIAYYMQYSDQHSAFRTGANPGFHEAIGDALALVVLTPKHLQCKLDLDLGLDSSICDDDSKSPESKVSETIMETGINQLYITALSKIVNFPFALSLELWRWEVFEGKISPDQYNKRWWELKMKHQGIVPASLDRITNSTLFDPSAKYHILGGVPYIAYFVSQILEFQFYEAMCIAAKQYNPAERNTKPLYQCDFSGSKEAGKVLGDMMRLGASKGWPAALEAITGNKSMSITPLKHYFQPLIQHIEKVLEKNGEVPGFEENCQEKN